VRLQKRRALEAGALIQLVPGGGIWVCEWCSWAAHGGRWRCTSGNLWSTVARNL